jgi:hypothetical protein
LLNNENIKIRNLPANRTSKKLMNGHFVIFTRSQQAMQKKVIDNIRKTDCKNPSFFILAVKFTRCCTSLESDVIIRGLLS